MFILAIGTEGNTRAKPVFDDVMQNFEGMHRSTAANRTSALSIPKQKPDLQLCCLLLVEPSAPEV